ncbi:flagellar protein FliS [Ectothiorhodospira haloalkaliphila]|uniref:flagellar protein FliS n=1 Tax=Ectothiorhodospira haloalkaliphila TaxID=421628 RepID=UPI001EE85C0E|nr:flagellar protein FliS [Ectothiorhodospira haloalkaliphila]MCG5524778.1 flagellar protein FliS [Ectothiorhodospira haloalkaliphila]
MFNRYGDGGIDRLAQARGAAHRGDRSAKIKFIGKAFDIIGGLRGGLDLGRGVTSPPIWITCTSTCSAAWCRPRIIKVR